MDEQRRERSNEPRGRRFLRWVLVGTVLLVLVVPAFCDRTSSADRVPYDLFQEYLDSGRIARVEIGATYMRAVLKAPDASGRTAVVTTRVEPTLARDLDAHHVSYTGVEGSSWLTTLLVWLAPMLLIFALWFFLARRALGQQAGALAIGRSRAKIYMEQRTRVTFDDVAGVDEAKAELCEVVSFLRNPLTFGRLGAHVPKGVLLVGPPGTGKTLLARAVAGEAEVPFFSINGSEFVELFVGVGAARVRDLFERARQNAPCIIFIDEVDALGRARGAGAVSGANDEKEQTLNQLLAELDGFSTEGGVVLLAATNRPETLDPALLRAGRFDRQILVDRPDRAGRVQILRVHSAHVRVARELDLDVIAGMTPGFTGADLANLVNEAALTATRRNAEAVTLEDFGVAVERIVAGLAKKSRVLSAREREITAFHETGHALVALGTPGADPVHKVSIIPHGLSALGFTMQRPAEERYIATRVELEGKMTVLLGGRAAELVAFGELSTGAADDLAKATELARSMVMSYGMDAHVGHVVYGDTRFALPGVHPSFAPEQHGYSEQTAREIEDAVKALVQGALDRAVALLTLNRDALDTTARLLIERETLGREQLPKTVIAPEEQGVEV